LYDLIDETQVDIGILELEEEKTEPKPSTQIPKLKAILKKLENHKDAVVDHMVKHLDNDDDVGQEYYEVSTNTINNNLKKDHKNMFYLKRK
jgi:hypothetical protein